MWLPTSCNLESTLTLLHLLQTLITRRLSTRTSSEFVVAALPRARRKLTHIALQVVMASVYDIIVTRNLNDIIL